jgi:hypothetical protein
LNGNIQKAFALAKLYFTGEDDSRRIKTRGACKNLFFSVIIENFEKLLFQIYFYGGFSVLYFASEILFQSKSHGKNLFLFPARKISKDGRASWCKACYKIYWNKRYFENHAHYRSSHNASRNKIREKNARKVFEFLQQNPCKRCGETDPIVLEFDHLEKTDKIESISNMIANASWQQIESEIAKCDVLCANCHRRKSAAEFNYKRHVFVNV